MIIDYLCDWARVVYRRNVLKCLAGGEANLRDLTPADIHESYQDDDDDMELSQRLGSAEIEPEFHMGREDAMDIETYPALRNAALLETAYPLNFGPTKPFPALRPILCRLRAQCRSRHRTTDAMIRDERLAVIVVPEDHEALKLLLEDILPQHELTEAARILLDIVLDEERTVTTTGERIRGLEVQNWPLSEGEEIDRNSPVRVAVCCRPSQVRFIPGELPDISFSMLTCRQEAAAELAIIAGNESSVFQSLSYWTPHECDCLASAFYDQKHMFANWINRTDMNEEMVLHLRLRPTDDSVHFRWVNEACD